MSNFFDNSQEREQSLRDAGLDDMADIMKANREGYAGILQNGQIVDRRKFPDATPVPENKMMGISEVKYVYSQNQLLRIKKAYDNYYVTGNFTDDDTYLLMLIQEKKFNDLSKFFDRSDVK